MSQSPKKGQAATVNAVAASTSDTLLIAAGAGPNGRMIFNDSTAILYLRFGAGASASNHTTQIAPGGFYQAPNDNNYAGQINGAWASATGNARITVW
jgi:hypothetical protein